MILAAEASGGPGVTDILTAIGTVGAVIAAVAIALWTDRRAGKQIKAERKLALEQEQEAAANAVQVTLVADGPGDDHTWMLAVLVVNRSSFVITDVDARVRTPARKHLIEPAMREKVPGSHRLSPELVQGMSARAEALADTGTLGSWDDGIRFQSALLDTGQVIGAYPVARWTDRWGGRWEYVSAYR